MAQSAALELRLGRHLVRLCVGDRLLRLGFSCLSDYARHRLDMAGRTARWLVSRPLLRVALFTGAITIRKALTILPVAEGEEEAWWVAFARKATVRKLEGLVRERRGEAGEAEELFRVRFPMSSEDRAWVTQALSLAGRILGAGTPQWDRIATGRVG